MLPYGIFLQVGCDFCKHVLSFACEDGGLLCFCACSHVSLFER